MSTRDITHTIFYAGKLYDRFGKALNEDVGYTSLLERLCKGIDHTRRTMHELGVVAECADCAVHGEGTCCSMPTGYKCDRVLLLINLLMGVTLPVKDVDPSLCYFLTPQGCMLKARPVICVNFICRRLTTALPASSLILLQQVAGEELSALFLLEEYLKKKIPSERDTAVLR